jgi:hypothetical protein
MAHNYLKEVTIGDCPYLLLIEFPPEQGKSPGELSVCSWFAENGLANDVFENLAAAEQKVKDWMEGFHTFPEATQPLAYHIVQVIKSYGLGIKHWPSTDEDGNTIPGDDREPLWTLETRRREAAEMAISEYDFDPATFESNNGWETRTGSNEMVCTVFLLFPGAECSSAARFLVRFVEWSDEIEEIILSD